MRFPLAPVTLLALAAACSAPGRPAPAEPAPAAAAAAPRAGACIRETLSTSWIAHDERTVLVRDGARAFRVTTDRCPRLADPVPRITRILKGGSSICSPRDVELRVSDLADSFGSPCLVREITPISEVEAKALEARRPR